MKRIRKTGVFALILLLAALLPAMTANAGFRKMKSGKYRYYYTKTNYVKKKFKNIKSKGKTYTYYFDKKGYMAVGWKKLSVKGKASWYYFDANGRMYKNRTKNGHYLQKDGCMLTNGWMGGVYYGEDGTAVPGYRTDVKNGFVKTKKGVKYRQSDGTYAAKTWKCIKDSEGKYYWYYFYSTGYMAKNKWVGSRWMDANGRWDSGKKR